MFIVLLCSVVLVILPIFIVQYQRFLASCPPRDPNGNLWSLRAGFQGSHRKQQTSYDGAASDSASEGPSDLHPSHAVSTVRYEGRESRKPWEPPFPTRARTGRNPYLVLPRTEEPEDRARRKWKGSESEGRSTSQLPHEGEEDGLVETDHLPVTGLSSYSAPVLPTIRSSSPVHQPQTTVQPNREAPVPRIQIGPEPESVTSRRGGALSLIQTIALVLAVIIFIFAFAILVAHCMASFVVYRTEARLGEVRKGLLRSGEMRVCLCAR